MGAMGRRRGRRLLQQVQNDLLPGLHLVELFLHGGHLRLERLNLLAQFSLRLVRRGAGGQRHQCHEHDDEAAYTDRDRGVRKAGNRMHKGNLWRNWTSAGPKSRPAYTGPEGPLAASAQFKG